MEEEALRRAVRECVWKGEDGGLGPRLVGFLVEVEADVGFWKDEEAACAVSVQSSLQ